MHNPNGKYIHKPNEKNSLGPYFTSETIELCREDFKKVISYFSKTLVQKLAETLSKREVDGSFAWSDLMGTVARLQGYSERTEIMRVRKELYQKIGRVPGIRENDFEYWFLQISGRPSLGKSVDRHNCWFTNKTIAWCEELV